MRDDFRSPVFSPPPKEYDQQYMDQVVRELNIWIKFMKTTGPVKIGPRVTLESLPTSATGLNAGELWNDSGTVKIKV